MEDVVVLVTPAGEMVGRVKEENDLTITLENPRAFVQTGEGAGFAPGVCVTGKEKPDTVTFQKPQVILQVDAAESVAKAWLQSTSGLVLAQ